MLKIQDHLGEVVFVELPEPGGAVTQASGFGAVESVKATSDVNSPISGEIVEVNTKLTETPGLVSSLFDSRLLISFNKEEFMCPNILSSAFLGKLNEDQLEPI